MQEMATKGGAESGIEAAPSAERAGNNISDDVGGHGATGAILAFFSFCLVVLFFPFSLFSTIKVSTIVSIEVPLAACGCC